jgi:uncharacterized protein (DUF2336 family)
MSNVQSLIDEIEGSFRSGTASSRAAILRRITDLFLESIDSLDQHVSIFDDVLCGLIEKIEAKAVAELSRQIAPLAKAPRVLSCRMSQHDDIDIAGPILRHSVVLSEDDLIKVARAKSQLHLEALANRPQVSERVSDVLIDRGNSMVLSTVANNAGARFSPDGYTTLATQAETDANIASALIRRSDMSPEMFRRLVSEAGATVKQRLLTTADRGMKEQVQRVIQSIEAEICRNTDRAMPVRGSQAGAKLKAIDKGKLRAEVLDYASAGRTSQTATALAALAELSIDTVRQLLLRHDYELLLIVCKASGLGWPAVRAILELASKSRDVFSFNSGGLLEQYNKLSRESADRVMRFIKVRKAASGAEIQQLLAG